MPLAEAIVVSLPRLKRLTFHDLSAWPRAGLELSLQAFRRSAAEILETGIGFQRASVFGGSREDWTEVCTQALAATDGRAFFEENFQPVSIFADAPGQPLFTGYFEPEAEASPVPHKDFPVPLYRRPTDLVKFTENEIAQTGLSYGLRRADTPAPYFTRREIECGALAGQGLELAWLKSWVDAFFIQVQGQGRLRMTDGTVMRLAFAAKSGLPYTGIGQILAGRGDIDPSSNSMQSIRTWMNANPAKSRELMWCNESFVFFRPLQVNDLQLGSVGAQYVNLTPRRSLAVDRGYWMFGTPLWLETTLPPEAGGDPFHELMIAQDTGTAIRGAIRGDVYWGWAEDAGWIAGHMKSSGRLVALLPKGLAARVVAP